jgi:hypothetical protein
MEGAPPVANQIDLFMHFLGASRDGLVARPVEMDKLSSSDKRGVSNPKFLGLGHYCEPTL